MTRIRCSRRHARRRALLLVPYVTHAGCRKTGLRSVAEKGRYALCERIGLLQVGTCPPPSSRAARPSGATPGHALPPPGRMPRRGPRPWPAAAARRLQLSPHGGKRALAPSGAEGRASADPARAARPLVLHENVRLVREQRLALPRSRCPLSGSSPSRPRADGPRRRAGAPRLRLLDSRRGARRYHPGVSLRRPGGPIAGPDGRPASSRRAPRPRRLRRSPPGGPRRCDPRARDHGVLRARPPATGAHVAGALHEAGMSRILTVAPNHAGGVRGWSTVRRRVAAESDLRATGSLP